MITMQWSEVINSPYFKDLSFKIELNKWGQILMSPASNNHGKIQFRIGYKIARKKQSGEVITECSIETTEGVKVADVAWASDEFLERHGMETPFSHAPEICVVVISPSSSRGEIDEKIQLYLVRGAREVWIVSEDGVARYYNRQGEISESREVSG